MTSSLHENISAVSLMFSGQEFPQPRDCPAMHALIQKLNLTTTLSRKSSLCPAAWTCTHNGHLAQAGTAEGHQQEYWEGRAGKGGAGSWKNRAALELLVSVAEERGPFSLQRQVA